MATAYTHIEDVVKRAIQYVDTRLDELEDEWNALDDEREMWDELRKQKIKGLDKSFLAELSSECKRKCKGLNYVSQEFGRLLKALNPCEECGGTGELREMIAQDESRYHTCSKCGGKGYGD